MSFRVRDPGHFPLYMWEIYWKILQKEWEIVSCKREAPFGFYYLELKSPKGETDIYTLDGRP